MSELVETPQGARCAYGAATTLDGLHVTLTAVWLVVDRKKRFLLYISHSPFTS